MAGTKIRVQILLSLFFSCAIAFAEPTELACEQALIGPKWLESGVVYSVFPRNFSATGDLSGVTKGLPAIKEFGADIVWLMPLQPTGQTKKKGALGSPYSVQDYEKINPAYGTPADLKNLTKRAHDLGLKVIVDAVLNHTSWDSVLMKHPEFYLKDASGQIRPPLPDWSDVAALDYSNPDLQIYILKMLKDNLREYDLDGFRFDASDFIPLEFWVKVRKELLSVKPDILLLGEGEKPQALCTGFDLDYDWRFKRAIDDIVMKGAPATATIRQVLKQEAELFPQNSLHLRFIDNHDERRAIARYGEKGTLAAAALLFTFTGVPLIYNGMEVGDTTESCAPALFESLPIFWDAAILRPEFGAFYKKIIAFRRAHPALIHGTTVWLENKEDESVLTFLRKLPEETVLVAINLSNQPSSLKLSLEGKVMDIMREGERKPLNNLLLPAWSVAIYEVAN